jgi:H+/Cl- antiporter ClcA
MSATSGSAPAPPFPQTPQFWVLMVNALGLGVFGACVALLFMGLIGLGDNWYTASDPGWFGGHWWWLAVTAAAGGVVGLLRRWIQLPDKVPSLIDDLERGNVDGRSVPGVVAVSAASLIGGASLGPEQALGAMGGGAGQWMARRRRLNDEDSQVNTRAGFAGAYGGLFSSTVIVVMLILEVSRPGGQRMAKTLTATIVSSSVSFAIYFVVAGAFFLDAYAAPSFTFEDWQLLAGVGLGLFAAVVVTLLGAVMKLAARMFGRLKVPAIVRPVIGGLAFGMVGVILPLTMFTGSDQLKTVLQTGETLGAGLLAALVIAKMLTFAVCQASGFVGGPIFPALFIGGTAGVFVHQVFPDIPLGLAFTCMLAAVPGALVSAPFALVLLAAFMSQLGALQTAPVLLAVITAFLAIESVKYVAATRRRSNTPTSRDVNQ